MALFPAEVNPQWSGMANQNFSLLYWDRICPNRLIMTVLRKIYKIRSADHYRLVADRQCQFETTELNLKLFGAVFIKLNVFNTLWAHRVKMTIF